MHKIGLGFSKPKGKFVPVSWLIRLVEGTKYSHAYIRVRSESLERDLIYEATGSGVYFVGSQTFESKATVIEEYDFQVTSETKKSLLQWAIDTSGKPYGRTQMLGLGLKRLAMVFGIKMKNIAKTGNKAYVCTELAAEALKELKLFEDLELDDIGLAELRVLVLKAFWEQNPKS